MAIEGAQGWIVIRAGHGSRGGMSVILDKDASNELSVLARGGYYVKIRKGRDSGMAPLKAVSNTPEARAWLEEFLGRSGGEASASQP